MAMYSITFLHLLNSPIQPVELALQSGAEDNLCHHLFTSSQRYCRPATATRWLYFLADPFNNFFHFILLKSKKTLASAVSFRYVSLRYLNKNTSKEVPCQEPANCPPSSLHVKTIDWHLRQVALDKIARISKFYRRTPQKISALPFIAALCTAAYENIFSFSKIAFLLGINVSKQAVADRFNSYAVAFFKQTLNALIDRVSGICAAKNQGVLAYFGKVYLQDSTHLSLPQHLADAYPGAKNQSGKKNAGMKIQAIFNLKNEQMADFGLFAFNRTDQTGSKDILELVQPKDLVIRDLGYFVLDVFKKLVEKGAFFLSRLKSKVAVYCPRTGKRLNLLDILKNQSCTDIDVLIGSDHKLPVRLVAMPVPDHIANQRRRKAKSNRDRRCKPSRQSLQLLGWQIFITNVDCSIWAPSTVCRLYAIRWRIEIIFKAWKSHLALASIPEGSQNELDIYIYSQLFNITIFHAFFDHLNRYMIDKYNKFISMLKIAPLFGRILNAIYGLGGTITGGKLEDFLTNLLLRHCCYEKRNKRTNYAEHLELLASLA